jgi:hypothetical protein
MKKSVACYVQKALATHDVESPWLPAVSYVQTADGEDQNWGELEDATP